MAPKREFDIDGPGIRLLPKSALPSPWRYMNLRPTRPNTALSNSSGRISVQWAVAERDAPQLQIVWTETGGPKVAAPSSKASIRGSSSEGSRDNSLVRP